MKKTSIKQMYVSILEDFEGKKSALLRDYFDKLAKAKRQGIKDLEAIMDKDAQVNLAEELKNV